VADGERESGRSPRNRGDRGGSGREAHPPPRKRLGQHFLSDPRILERIADAVAPQPGETILEIGPGRGGLTDLLAARATRLIAVELDRALAARLRERYAAQPHVSVVEADVLDIDLGAVAGGPFALVGNVPYYITTPILFHALHRPRPDRAVYLVQREVAERIVAPAGSESYGALSVNVQALARAEILFRVSAGAFQPPPRVESAVIRVTPRPDPVVDAEYEETYRVLVQAAFGLRRKQMRRVLRTIRGISAEQAEVVLHEAAIDADCRPETLTPGDFARLLRVLRLKT
jgi:16S rRNA (adenine1518-N6/adenine1519-N6)-dimethyltransferase